MVQKHKKIIMAIVFVLTVALINSVLSFALVKPGLTRVILNELENSEDFDCIILGTSHGSYAIDADITGKEYGKPVMNLCIGGAYMQDVYYLLKRAFETNTPRTIILDMDYQYLMNVPKNSVSANFIYYAYPRSFDKLSYFWNKILSQEYRAACFPWMDARDQVSNMAANVKVKMGGEYQNFEASAVTMEPADEYRGKGFIYRNRTHTRQAGAIPRMSWDPSLADKDSLNYIEKMIALCKKNNVKFIMTSTPVPKEYILENKEVYQEIHNYISKMALDYGVEYYDFSLVKDEVFLRTTDDYWDYDGHMYGDCAQRYSKVLGGFLKEYEKQTPDFMKTGYFHSFVEEIQ